MGVCRFTDCLTVTCHLCRKKVVWGKHQFTGEYMLVHVIGDQLLCFYSVPQMHKPDVRDAAGSLIQVRES
jgi:hypothetical protein